MAALLDVACVRFVGVSFNAVHMLLLTGFVSTAQRQVCTMHNRNSSRAASWHAEGCRSLTVSSAYVRRWHPCLRSPGCRGSWPASESCCLVLTPSIQTPEMLHHTLLLAQRRDTDDGKCCALLLKASLSCITECSQSFYNLYSFVTSASLHCLTEACCSLQNRCQRVSYEKLNKVHVTVKVSTKIALAINKTASP